MGTPAEPRHWGLRAGEGRHSQAGGVGPLGAHGGRQSLAGRSGGCQRVQTWCSGPVHGAWRSGFAGSHRPVECSAPLSAPACCPEPVWCQCWCQWMVLVPVLVSVPSPGGADSAWWHCLLCGVHRALCGAGASAQYQCLCWYPLLVPSSWYQWLVLVWCFSTGGFAWCPVPLSSAHLPLPPAPVQCQVFLSSSSPSAS